MSVTKSKLTSTILDFQDGNNSSHSVVKFTASGSGENGGTVTCSNNLVVGGNLTVSGTTTTVNSTTVNIQNAFVFEGATSDAHETTLTTVDPTSDRTIKLPNNSGTVVLGTDGTSYKLPAYPGSDKILQSDSSGSLSWVESGTSITGAATTIDTEDLAVSRALVSNASGKVAVSAVTSTELGYLDGVSSSIQTQLDAKQSTISGAATTIASSDLTVSRALVSDGSGKVAVSAVTSTEVGYLDGVTSAIQTQLDAKQATITDGDLTIARTTGLQTALDAKQSTISGAATTITGSDLTVSRAIISNASGKIEVSAVTSTELGYLDGVTSGVQTQLNAKQSTISGAATTITGSDLTASRAIISNASGKVEASDVTSTEIGYLDGVTSAIQTQLDAKQATITGAATTIDTENLTTSKALVSDANGKIAASTVTSTEVGYLVGVSSSIQTQLDAKQATISGAATTIDTEDLQSSRALVSDGNGKVAVSAVTSTEVGFLAGVGAGSVVNSKAVIYSSAGDIVAGSFTTSSDPKLKKDMTILPSALDMIDDINGYSYKWKDEVRGVGLQYGVNADEIEALNPGIVKMGEDGYKSVNYNALVGVLLGAIKELKAEVAELKTKV